MAENIKIVSDLARLTAARDEAINQIRKHRARRIALDKLIIEIKGAIDVGGDPVKIKSKVDEALKPKEAKK